MALRVEIPERVCRDYLIAADGAHGFIRQRPGLDRPDHIGDPEMLFEAIAIARNEWLNGFQS
jgi:hypothetical protein